VVHRDIKPDNLILDQAGNAKLMDFGIARPVERMTQGHTKAGWIVGTPQYMAPEQLEGRDLDGRADIYSSGVLLFELFTGRLPFTDDSPMQVAMHHLSSQPPSPRSFWPEMPVELERIILVCLAKKPENRFAKVDALFDALEGLSA
jgi:eukaryotic-like serine/threonine-protein kinase